jgi:predicted nucleotidyltransferase
LRWIEITDSTRLEAEMEMATLKESQAVLRRLSPTQEKVDQAVATVIATADPSRVFLFGSWARGEARWDSDLDLAVLVPDSAEDDLGRIRKELRRRLDQIPMTIDLVLSTESCAQEFLDSVNSIYSLILERGHLVYERESEGDRRSSAA